MSTAEVSWFCIQAPTHMRRPPPISSASLRTWTGEKTLKRSTHTSPVPQTPRTSSLCLMRSQMSSLKTTWRSVGFTDPVPTQVWVEYSHHTSLARTLSGDCILIHSPSLLQWLVRPQSGEWVDFSRALFKWQSSLWQVELGRDSNKAALWHSCTDFQVWDFLLYFASTCSNISVFIIIVFFLSVCF